MLSKPDVRELFERSFTAIWESSEDSYFYQKIGGFVGLLQMYSDLRYMVLIAKRWDLSEYAFVALRHRKQMAGVYIWLSMLENLARIFSRQRPHFCARFASEIAWEMTVKMQYLAEMYEEDLWELLEMEIARDRSSTGKGTG